MFQDFDVLERRKAENARKFKKRLIIAGSVTILLVAAAVAGVLFVHARGGFGGGGSDKDGGNASKPEIPKADETSRLEKGIKSVCKSTDYKPTCESSLRKALKNKKSTNDPMVLMKAAVAVIGDEIDKAFNNSIKTKIKDPKMKGAVEDCEMLLRDAKEELGQTISSMGGKMEQLSSKTDDIRNWLSAVLSYQETCIDGFPKGQLKSQAQKALKTSKELSSNALAIIAELVKFLSSLKVPGQSNRHLLANEPNHTSVDNDGFPDWMTHEDRRALKQETANLKPNVIVAKDGSGAFKTINAALAAMPKNYKGRYIIYVKEGVYDETVVVTKKMVNVTMYGDGSMKSVVTGSKNFVDGVRTFQTATFVALGDGFIAQSMGFRNTAGPEKHQAVALRVQADRAIFLNCRMEGYQDTLYAQTHRQFYRSCVISGTVDFVFGNAAAVIQNTKLVVRKPLDNQKNTITAQGRLDRHQTTGLVIQNCKIQPDDQLVPVKSKFKSYLGRPWKEYSRTIIMESEIGDFIDPEGWLPWDGQFGLKTLFYSEYKNTGPGAKLSGRVKWPGIKVINRAQAMNYTAGPFLQGERWMKGTGVPVRLGLYQ